jgi:hypothetical protein
MSDKLSTLTKKQAAAFMQDSPTELDSFTNQAGQVVTLYEHPRGGDIDPVYGSIHGVIFDTGFHDTEDMTYPQSEYAPILLPDGSVDCACFTSDEDIAQATAEEARLSPIIAATPAVAEAKQAAEIAALAVKEAANILTEVWAEVDATTYAYNAAKVAAGSVLNTELAQAAIVVTDAKALRAVALKALRARQDYAAATALAYVCAEAAAYAELKAAGK